MTNICWEVYRYNINANKIERFNIFKHYGFVEDLIKNIKRYKDKTTFANVVERNLMYYFWSKCQYELMVKFTYDKKVILYPWGSCKNPELVTLDVTNENNFNWKEFALKHISKQIFKDEAKIDIYNQVMFKFDEFIDYVWNNKEEICKLN